MGYADQWQQEMFWLWHMTEFRFWLFVVMVPIAEAVLWRALKWYWRKRGRYTGILLLLLCLAGDNQILFYMNLDYHIEQEMQRYIEEELRQPNMTDHEIEMFMRDFPPLESHTELS